MLVHIKDCTYDGDMYLIKDVVLTGRWKVEDNVYRHTHGGPRQYVFVEFMCMKKKNWWPWSSYEMTEEWASENRVVLDWGIINECHSGEDK